MLWSIVSNVWGRYEESESNLYYYITGRIMLKFSFGL